MKKSGVLSQHCVEKIHTQQVYEWLIQADSYWFYPDCGITGLKIPAGGFLNNSMIFFYHQKT